MKDDDIFHSLVCTGSTSDDDVTPRSQNDTSGYISVIARPLLYNSPDIRRSCGTFCTHKGHGGTHPKSDHPFWTGMSGQVKNDILVSSP